MRTLDRVPHACRSFSSSRVRLAALASHPPGHETELVYQPTPEALRELDAEDEDGPDIDLIPPEEAKLELTERAAEVRLECALYVLQAIDSCVPSNFAQ